MLSKDERLRKENDFRTTKKKKIAQARSSFLNLLAAAGATQKSRLGIVLPKKIGSAVVRNRIRRVFVEGYKKIKTEITKPFDIILYPSAESGGLSSKEAAALLKFGFKKAKII